MRKTRTPSASPSQGETLWGFGYLAIQLLVLPGLLTWGNGCLAHPLSMAELNFVFYFLNFLAILVIFHDFFRRSFAPVRQHPAYFCQAVVLGLVAYYASSLAVNWILRQLAPGFSNYNDQSIAALGQGSFLLTAIGTVILVPPVEECLYRGLIFRKLADKSLWVAYAVSILAFAMLHIVGYLGRYTLLEVLLAIFQYLPGGLCLAWCYTKADSIYAPILVHAAINAAAIGLLR